MPTEEGVIEKASRRNALVRIQKSSCCAQCESQGACQVLGDKEMIVEVPNDLRAREGDHVEITVPTGSLLKLSLLVYVLPILVLIAGAYAGAVLAPSWQVSANLASVLGGLTAMAAAFWVLRRVDRAVRKRQAYHPRMTRILFSAEAPSPGGSK